MQVEDHGSLPPGRGLELEIEALRCLDRAAHASSPRPGTPAPGRSGSRTGLHHGPPGAAAASAGRRGPGRRRRPDRHGPPGAAVASAGERRAEAGTGTGAGRGAAAASAGERLLVWESARLAVILPRRGAPEPWAHVAACAARGVPLLRRESGGGAVVVGPGCLNVALVLSLDRRPWLAGVERSYRRLLGRTAAALAVGGIAVRSTDLALRGRKFAGHAQRRGRGALLHHGVLLYDFDLDLVSALLAEPPRRPAWRGNRTHREFLTNAPLARDEIVERLRRLPAALER